jgi:hypothetical protein
MARARPETRYAWSGGLGIAYRVLATVLFSDIVGSVLGLSLSTERSNYLEVTPPRRQRTRQMV